MNSDTPTSMASRKRIAIMSRYCLSEQCKLAAEFKDMLRVLGNRADVLHLSLKDPTPPSAITGVAVSELPFGVNRGSTFDILWKSLLLYLSLPVLATRLRHFKPDVIYLSEALPLVGYFLKVLTRRKVAISYGDRHLHNRFGQRVWMRPLLQFFEWFEGFELTRVDGVFTRGETCRMKIMSYGVQRQRTYIVYDVPEPSAFYPRDMTALRHRCGFDENNVVLFYHGIMHTGKALDLLLRWTAELHKENPRIAMILVGTGPEEANLRHLAKERGLADRAHFTGWLQTVQEVGDFCNAADICVGMRRGDDTNSYAISGALVHSMACRKVLLAPRLQGMGEIVTDGVTGFLFDPNDGEDFKQIVRRLLADPTLCETIRNQAYEETKRRFSVDGAAHEYAAALEHYASLTDIRLERTKSK